MTKKVYLGGNGKTERIAVGGGEPVSVQTMWKKSIVGLDADAEKRRALVEEIHALKGIGCDIVRFAVPDMESARALCAIAAECTVPLVADIHFDYRLALECLRGNVAAIRINPGNIGSRENVEKVVASCREKNAAIRIGVNTGSFPKDLAAKVEAASMSRAEALSETASREAAVFDELGFTQFVVSMKASSVSETIEANEVFAKKYDIPLHIGVTEAGPLITGIVNEVIAGREILVECGKREGGVKLISCPRCGRIGFDVHAFVEKWQRELLSLDKNISVAVMGCVVNGPGEGKHADLGIAGSGNKVVIFKKGKIVRTVDAKDADKVFREELDTL